VKKQIAAGYDRLVYGFLNSSGYIIGPSTTLAAGSPGASAGQVLGVKTSAIAVPEPETTDITGNDTLLGQFLWSPNTLPSFIVETGINDLSLAAATQTTLVEDSGDLSFGVLEPSDPVYPDMALVLQRRSKSKESATSGLSQFEGIILPKVSMAPLGSDNFTERGAATFRYKVSTNPSEKFPWGKSINVTDNGTTAAPIITFTSQNRVHIHTWIQNDAALTVFGPLEFTPASSALAKNRIFVNGTIQTSGVTVDTVAKTVTFDVAPAEDDVIVIVYEIAL
jgi:hypothetical protein